MTSHWLIASFWENLPPSAYFLSVGNPGDLPCVLRPFKPSAALTTLHFKFGQYMKLYKIWGGINWHFPFQNKQKKPESGHVHPTTTATTTTHSMNAFKPSSFGASVPNPVAVWFAPWYGPKQVLPRSHSGFFAVGMPCDPTDSKGSRWLCRAIHTLRLK